MVAWRGNGRYTHPPPTFSRPRRRQRGRVSPAPHADVAATTQQAHGKSAPCAASVHWAGKDPALTTPST